MKFLNTEHLVVEIVYTIQRYLLFNLLKAVYSKKCPILGDIWYLPVIPSCYKSIKIIMVLYCLLINIVCTFYIV